MGCDGDKERNREDVATVQAKDDDGQAYGGGGGSGEEEWESGSILNFPVPGSSSS